MNFLRDKQVIKKIFLLLVIAVFSTAIFVNLSHPLTNDYFAIDTIANIVSIIIFLLIIYTLIKATNLTQKNIIIWMIIILTIGIVLRIISINFFDTVQVSDFKNAELLYKFLQNNEFVYQTNPMKNTALQTNFSLFPTWAFYSYLLYFLYQIFGFSYIFVKILNIALYIATSIFIYLGAKNIFSQKIGLLSVLIFSIAPTLIIYNNVATPDHFTILFMSIVIYIWSLILKCDNQKKKYLLTLVLIINMIFVNLFKPLSVYMLLVFICTELIVEIFGNKDKHYLKNNWKYYVFFILAFFIFNKTITYSMNEMIENSIQISVKDATSFYLLWGYSVDEEGKFDSNYVYTKVRKELVAKYNNDYDLILNDFEKIAYDNFKNNIKYLPSIWWSKFDIAFSNEMDYFSFANTSNNSDEIKLEYYNKVYIFTNTFMAINYLMLIICCIGLYKNKIPEKGTIIILLMIMGYVAILILGGVQSRYKSLISPQFFILFAVGFDYMLSKWHLNMAKTKKGVMLNVGYDNSSSL